jgi:hypothetical protein
MENSQLEGIEEQLKKTLKELDRIERHTKKLCTPPLQLQDSLFIQPSLY